MTNKILTVSKKASLIFWGIMVCFHASAQDIPSELASYFYTYKTSSYSFNNDGDDLSRTYNLFKNSYGRLCLKRVTSVMWDESIDLNEDTYILQIDKERQAIISEQQFYKNNFYARSQWAFDKTILFILPKDSNPIEWTEEPEDSFVTRCTAKFVYISFWSEGKKLYRKAVKIERTPTIDYLLVKNWTYWVKDYSKIATFGYQGDPAKTECIERSLSIDKYKPIEEITEAEYNRGTN
ncbi:MAG: hypothetical protein K2L79_04875 [Bacteroidales bacterium]|nr:hypothetical protein [Bacteroidales bacterium]